MPRTYTEEELQELLRRAGAGASMREGSTLAGDVVDPVDIGGGIDFSSIAPEPQQNYSDLYTQQASDALPAGPGMLDTLMGTGGQAATAGLGTQMSAAGNRSDSKSASIAGGAMEGFSAGAATGNPYAAGAGAVIGGISGALGDTGPTNSEKMDEIQKNLQTQQIARDFTTTQNKRAKPGIKGLARSIISPLVGIV